MKSRVYVGGLPYDVRERDLEKFFRGFGRLEDIIIKNGYGFIDFEDDRDADDAVHELNGKKLCGQRVTIERATGRPRGFDRRRYGDYGGGGGGDRRNNAYRDGDRNYVSTKYGTTRRTKYRLIVENLSSQVGWRDLKDLMRKIGEVTYADCHKECPNQGVVDFASRDDLKYAIKKLDGTKLSGRRIRLIEENAERERSKSRSHSRSRSRSRSRAPRSRSRSNTRGRDGSPAKFKSKRDGSRSVSKERQGANSRDRSLDKSKDHSKSRERSVLATRCSLYNFINFI